MAILQAFNVFPDEAALIGRMLAGYADLEIVLMHSVKVVREDLDLALKTMFRGRGNSLRIDVADAIARQPYIDIGIGAEFERAISAIRHCLKIRNLYAHCTWWDDLSGQLAFANLEELADTNTVITDLHGLTVNHVTTPHLQQQFSYFEYTDNLFTGIIQEHNRLTGKPAIPGIVIPVAIAQPPKYM